MSKGKLMFEIPFDGDGTLTFYDDGTYDASGFSKEDGRSYWCLEDNKVLWRHSTSHGWFTFKYNEEVYRLVNDYYDKILLT